MNSLTQKERMYLDEQKRQEELCIKKYHQAAEQAQDPELKDLFMQLASQEQQHLDTINQMLSGQIPQINQQSQPKPEDQKYYNKPNPGGPPQASKNDIDLCIDLLNTEKYVSSVYNTAIFEFNNHELRNALNHIQKEEQEHGEKIYNYLKSKNSYSAQA